MPQSPSLDKIMKNPFLFPGKKFVDWNFSVKIRFEVVFHVVKQGKKKEINFKSYNFQCRK